MFDLVAIENSIAKFLFRMDGNGRRRLWLKLAKLIGNGVPILMALESMASRRAVANGKSDSHVVVMSQWVVKIKNGERLSSVLYGFVGDDERMLINAGEQAGSLEQSLISAARVMEARVQINRAIIGGLTYPFIMLCVAFGILYMFSYKMVPAFTSITHDAHWTGRARVLVEFSGFVQNWLWLIALLLIGLIATFSWSLAHWDGRVRVILDRYVPYSIYRVVLGSTWLISFAALIEAGLRVEGALRLLAQCASSPWLRTRIEACLRGTQSGLNVGEALSNAGHAFPDREIIDDLGVYSSLSGFDAALSIIGKEWLEESVRQIQLRMKVIYAISLSLVGALFLFLVIGFVGMELQITSIMKNQ